MRCRSCQARLEYDDNYCRKCGVAAEVYGLQVINAAPPAPPATFREVAVPAVAQATTVLVAGTLFRFALKQLLGRQSSGRSILPFGRRETPLAGDVVEEVTYYRRFRVR